MHTEFSSTPFKTQTTQPETAKYSLRVKTKISQTAESTTTCTSLYPNGKISLKSISSKNQVSHSTKKTQPCYYLNIKYQDIKTSKKASQNNFLNNFFCGQLPSKNTMGCHCHGKCRWNEKWMNLVPTDFHKQPFKPSDLKSIQQSVQIQVEKDLKRTQPQYSTFENDIYLNRLQSTLFTYSLCDPEVGYMQGMNIVASVPVYHSKSSYQAQKIFQTLMIKYNLREIYKSQLKQAKMHCSQIIKLLKSKANDLYLLLTEDFEIELQLFIIGWLFSLLGSFIPLQKMHLVIDSYIEKGWSAIYSIIFTILIYLRDELFQAGEQTQVMRILSIQGLKENHIDWEQIIYSAENIPINEKDLL